MAFRDPLDYSFSKELHAQVQKYYPGREVPVYAIQAILPRLNKLGKLGWELVNLEPVVVGMKGDICPGSTEWTNVYLCAFKRLKRSAES